MYSNELFSSAQCFDGFFYVIECFHLTSFVIVGKCPCGYPGSSQTFLLSGFLGFYTNIGKNDSAQFEIRVCLGSSLYIPYLVDRRF